jgi:cytochrome c551
VANEAKNIAVYSGGDSMRKEFMVGAVMMSLAVCMATLTLLYPISSRAEGTKTANSAATVQAGQDIFQQRCMQCHSVVAGQAMFGPSLFHEMKKPHGSASDIRTILQNGKGKMPSFKDRLTPEDTNNLLAYLHTL